MAYTKTTWADSPATSSPISAANLNNIEDGVFNAHTKVDVNAQTGTSYTLVLTDAGKVVEVSNAGTHTLTVPLNSSVAFVVGTIIEVSRYGVGAVTIAATGGVTLNSPGGLLSIASQYDSVSLRKRATDEWIIVGPLA